MDIGDMLKTVGGWDALIIWIPYNDLQNGFYAIHKPNTINESVPIYHHQDGSSHSIFSVHEPPVFDKQHPANIIIKTK